ncbi:MAG: FAD-dependent oxidoreductase, partial [Armatimonadota bacterium]|nr:FAD-dependent oxidoreductase [Armatimonadota bacterium]
MGIVWMVGALFAAAEAPVVWLEAEYFREKGGWVDDSQFLDLVGSSYLLACGVGRPVADAVTTAHVPVAGDYRLWVRCRDWIPEHSPGKFQVWVDGRPSPATFGVAADDQWRWVDGGVFSLRAGEVEVRLRDLTGWWGRCDAVVLTAGPRPSDDPAELARQRERWGGVSASVRQKGEYDLVVVGGGLAGCAAAIAAARHGCRVVLVQDRPVLGGNASSEIGVGPSGDTSKDPLDPRETGIIEELEPPGAKGDRSERYERVVRGQAGVELLLNTRATGVRMGEGGRIAAVQALELPSGQRLEIAGRFFADCTGDAWIGYWAGADYRQGREGRAEYNEPAAPPEADPHTLSTSLTRCTIISRDHPVPFTPPPWVPTWKSCADFDPKPKATVHSDGDLPPEGWYEMRPGKGRHPDTADAIRGAWWLELGGVRDTIADAERIRDDLFRLKLGLWDHLKNHCDQFRQENANRELVWQSHIAGKRESRRLLGDYVMSQRDYMERQVHPDTALYAGYNIDPHHPLGFWADGPQAFRLYHHKVSVP